MLNRPVHDRPLAVAGLTSYRYPGRYGWIMIGAGSPKGALDEAWRSLYRQTEDLDMEKLQVWSDQACEYVPVTTEEN